MPYKVSHSMVTMQNNVSDWLEERINLLEPDEIENLPELVCMSHDSLLINHCWYIAMVEHVLTDLYLSKRCADNNSVDVPDNY